MPANEPTESSMQGRASCRLPCFFKDNFLESKEMKKSNPSRKKTIEQVLKDHTDTLMALSGVVGTAMGERAGKPFIRVFVVTKIPDLLNQIPSSIEGYPVHVQETGEIRALGSNYF